MVAAAVAGTLGRHPIPCIEAAVVGTAVAVEGVGKIVLARRAVVAAAVGVRTAVAGIVVGSEGSEGEVVVVARYIRPLRLCSSEAVRAIREGLSDLRLMLP